MKTLFLGHFAATVAPRIFSKVKTPLETNIRVPQRPTVAGAAVAQAGSLRKPRSWLVIFGAPGSGASCFISPSLLPKGVTVCNVFGHEPAIAEYVIMTMLVLTHRLF